MKFILITTCKIVEGFIRDCIYDLERHQYFFIPKSLTEILLTYSGKTTWNKIKKTYSSESEIIDEYYKFLVKNELLFFANETNNFIELENTW